MIYCAIVVDRKRGRMPHGEKMTAGAVPEEAAAAAEHTGRRWQNRTVGASAAVDHGISR